MTEGLTKYAIFKHKLVFSLLKGIAFKNSWEIDPDVVSAVCLFQEMGKNQETQWVDECLIN